MRRLIFFACLLVAMTSVARADFRADQDEQLDQILRLVQEGVSDELVIKQIQASGFVFDLTADDILELRRLGVDEDVIGAMLDTAIQDKESGRTRRDGDDRDASSRRHTYTELSASLSPGYWNISAGYFSPWYYYPYAWGFYYDPFPSCYSFYYYPFRYASSWGYYGSCNHYYYRNLWRGSRFDSPRYFATRVQAGGGIRVPRPPVPRDQPGLARVRDGQRGVLVPTQPEPPVTRRSVYRRDQPDGGPVMRRFERDHIRPPSVPPQARRVVGPRPPDGRRDFDPARRIAPFQAPPSYQPPRVRQPEWRSTPRGMPQIRTPVGPPRGERVPAPSAPRARVRAS